MLCMLYLLYYIVIFKVIACVCIYPDMLCVHFCIIYVCMFVYMSAYDIFSYKVPDIHTL